MELSALPGHTLQQTITQKIAGQGQSDLHVVFTMTLCGTDFCIW